MACLYPLKPLKLTVLTTTAIVSSAWRRASMGSVARLNDGHRVSHGLEKHEGHYVIFSQQKRFMSRIKVINYASLAFIMSRFKQRLRRLYLSISIELGSKNQLNKNDLPTQQNNRLLSSFFFSLSSIIINAYQTPPNQLRFIRSRYRWPTTDSHQSNTHRKYSAPWRKPLATLSLLLGALYPVTGHSALPFMPMIDPISSAYNAITKQVSWPNHIDKQADKTDAHRLFKSSVFKSGLFNTEMQISYRPVLTDLNGVAHTRPSLLRVMQATFLIDRGDIKRGLALYKKEAFKTDSIPVFERALALSLRYEPVEDSLTFANTWQQHNPEHLPARFYVAHLALKAHDYKLAGDVLTRILALDTKADLSDILLGVYPSTLKNRQQFLAMLNGLPEHRNPSLLVIQAGLLAQLGQPERALESINQALLFAPDSIPFMTLKADILNQLQAPQAVIDYISEARHAYPDSKDLYLYDIRYRIAHGQTHEAWQLLLEANTRFNDDEITLLAALISIDIEAYETADELLADLVASPDYTDRAYYYLGISHERQQDYDKALQFFARVSQNDLVLSAKQKQVAIYLLQNKEAEALMMLSQFDRDYEVYRPDSAIMQADILRRQNKLTQAKHLLATVHQQFPDHAQLLVARARLLDNDTDGALKKSLIDRLIFLDPDNPEYQMARATLLFESNRPEDMTESLQIAQSIIDIPFNSPLFNQSIYIQALNLIAADALSSGEYQQVVDYLQTIYDVTPTLNTGILLLRAYQGLKQGDAVATLFTDMQSRFSLGQQDISDRLQAY